jgi:hypothetical protein
MEITHKSKERGRLDRVVVISIMVILVLASIMAFTQYKKYIAGSEIQIKYPPSNNFVNRAVQFSCVGAGNEPCAWNFGDGVSSTDTGQVVNHIYTQPGQYLVSVIVNNRYAQYEIIRIEKLHDELRKKRLVPVITYAPRYILPGDAVKFTDNNPLGTRWTWNFGDGRNTDSKINSATYRFSTPGNKTIRMFLNNDPLNDTSFTITVSIPDGPAFAPAYTPEQLQELLREVNKGNKTVADFGPYINRSADRIMIDYQEKSKKLVMFKKTRQNNISLTEACSRLAKAGAIKEISIMNLRHDKFNFITGMSIVIRK